MPDQVLSLSYRPQTLDEMVGQKRMARIIRKQYESGRAPAAWMFISETGGGKTTLARILALSLQCPHQEQFGQPCEKCQKNRADFDIIEINASEVSGVQEVGEVVIGANYTPKPPSKYRVFIFDEAQRLSDAAQNLMLKYLEDSPKSTIWIICTTEPRKILRTVRRRCMVYTIEGLGMKGVARLVEAAIAFAGEKLPAAPLVDALLEAGVTSPGLVVNACEKYLAGEEAEKAAQVVQDSSLNTLHVCRAVSKGDWETVKNACMNATPEDAAALRGAVAGYLKAILLNSDPGSHAKLVSDGIQQLVAVGRVEDGLQLAGTIAVLYKICSSFTRS